MKRINLGTVKIQGAEKSILDLLKSWTESSSMDINNPQKPLNIKTVRERSRVVEKLEAVPKDAAFVDIEDGDLDVLKDVLTNTGFVVSGPGLVKVIDAVEKAEAPPTIQ